MTGGQIWAGSASCPGAAARGATVAAPKGDWFHAINGADRLIDWWLAEVRHRFGDDWSDPDTPMLPSERHSKELERCRRVGQCTRCAKGCACADGEMASGVVGTVDPACAASLLRLVALWRRGWT